MPYPGSQWEKPNIGISISVVWGPIGTTNSGVDACSFWDLPISSGFQRISHHIIRYPSISWDILKYPSISWDTLKYPCLKRDINFLDRDLIWYDMIWLLQNRITEDNQVADGGRRAEDLQRCCSLSLQLPVSRLFHLCQVPESALHAFFTKPPLPAGASQNAKQADTPSQRAIAQLEGYVTANIAHIYSGHAKCRDPLCANCCRWNRWSPHPWPPKSFQKTSWAHLTDLSFSLKSLFSPSQESIGNGRFRLCSALYSLRCVSCSKL